MAHPLDRPAWHALASRQAGLAIGDARARRFEPAFAAFAAARDGSGEALAAMAALVRADDEVATVEAEPLPTPDGLKVVKAAPCCQMTAAAITSGRHDLDVVDLTEDDAAAMLALARSTEPGPFFARTHQLGRFVGIKREGQLVAMAGERMHLPGFHEVSAVCTHPAHRGRGYAAALTRRVATRILADGDVPFLQAYADNAAAIALYRSLGFEVRREVMFTLLATA